VIQSKFPAVNPQVLGATVQNLGACVTWY